MPITLNYLQFQDTFGSLFPHRKFSSVQSCGFLENSPTLLYFSFHWLILLMLKIHSAGSFSRKPLANIREMLPFSAPLILCTYLLQPTPSPIIRFFLHCIVMVHLLAYPILPVSKQLEGKYHVLPHCLGNRGHSRYFLNRQ